MGSKEEWEELKQWEEQKKQNQEKELGLNFEDLNTNKLKWIDKSVKFLKGISIVGIAIAIIILIIVVIAIASYMVMKYSSVKNNVDVDFKSIIKAMYGVDIKIISKDVDEKENGLYTVKDKENNVTFHVRKNFGKMTEDYFACILKSKFEKWESKSKESFIVEEKIENNMQNYNVYIEIENEDELIDATRKIIEFYDFCQFKYFAACNVYIKYKNSRIYPYTSYITTEEDAINNAKESFNNINKLK